MSGLNELERLIGPPTQAAPPVDWGNVERVTGLVFPADYREYCQKYSALLIDDFISISHPSAKREAVNLIRAADRYLAAMRELREGNESDVPYPIYPELNGIFPWGVTDNGDWLFWQTADNPNDWIVVATDRGDWYEYRGTFTSFLVALLGGRLGWEMFTDVFGEELHVYEYE
jgi:hypothetical protein